MTTRNRCAICGADIDPSACGQFLVRINTEDDSLHEITGKTLRQRLILCQDHSLSFNVWLAEQQLKAVAE